MVEPATSCAPWSGTAATTGSSNVAKSIAFQYIPCEPGAQTTQLEGRRAINKLDLTRSTS